MNIEKKLQALRRAKKLRPLLMYRSSHLDRDHGIDVPEDQFQRVQAFVKTLFKAAKRGGFDIQINHWGAIYLIDPDRQIPVALSVNIPTVLKVVDGLEQRLKETPYIVLNEPLKVSNQLNVGFRAWRPGTKWRYRDIKEKEQDASLAEEVIADIKI